MDWSVYPNFEEREFACSHCGQCKMRPELIEILQSIRSEYGKPIFISSGYRCPDHPVESMKDEPGEHTKGMAADIICYTLSSIELMRLALNAGIQRLGVHQKGRASTRFIHIGIGDKLTNEYSKTSWTY